MRAPVLGAFCRQVDVAFLKVDLAPAQIADFAPPTPVSTSRRTTLLKSSVPSQASQTAISSASVSTRSRAPFWARGRMSTVALLG